MVLRKPLTLVRRCVRWEGWRRPAARLGLTGAAMVGALGVVGTVGGFVVPALAAQNTSQHRPTTDPRNPHDTVPGTGLPDGLPGAAQPSG
ncbi:MAG: hypothetical protein WCA46_18990, partial [Actinocatenispora sp.]